MGVNDIEIESKNGHRRIVSIGTFPDHTGTAPFINFSVWREDGLGNWQGSMDNSWRSAITREDAEKLCTMLERMMGGASETPTAKMTLSSSFEPRDSILEVAITNGEIVLHKGISAALAIPETQGCKFVTTIRKLLSATEKWREKR